MGITLAILSLDGTIPVDRGKLKIWLRGVAIIVQTDFTMAGLILSKPLLVPDLKELQINGLVIITSA